MYHFCCCLLPIQTLLKTLSGGAPPRRQAMQLLSSFQTQDTISYFKSEHFYAKFPSTGACPTLQCTLWRMNLAIDLEGSK